MENKPQTTPEYVMAAKRLSDALIEVKAPHEMVKRACEGYYGDFSSPLATPISQLVEDCYAMGMKDMAKRAMNGEFDGI